MNFANIIWMWGHPEVYILILPAFGIYSEIVATFSSKSLFGYKSLVFATVVIALMAFTTWLHHFFTMGAGASVNTAFGITTMIIAVPTGVKVFDWLMTMFRGRIRYETPMLWTVAFLVTFTIGGVSGVLLAVPAVDYTLHNTTFLVAHFHNMVIPGVLFGFFAGYTFWFPKAFGFRLDEGWGKLAFWFWLTGFYLAFMPLYALGFMGMVRRLEHYENPDWQPYLIVAALGAVCVLFGLICIAIQLWVSIRKRVQLADTTGDPWNARTLEWYCSSPPPPWNFARLPEIDGLDAFWKLKVGGEAYREDEVSGSILLPGRSMDGVVYGVLAFVLGFSMVWHIYWLAVVCAGAIAGYLIAGSFRSESKIIVPAELIRRHERSWKAAARAASRYDGDPIRDFRPSLRKEPAE